MQNNLQKFLQVFKGDCYSKIYIKKYQRVIAFDLDETLGSFYHLSILWSGLRKLQETALQSEFNKILDLYPEFLRYGILTIIEYLYLKKKQGECDKIYIYTNNTCDPPWVSLLTCYFKYKLNVSDDIFDQTICAFKINNKIVELVRTTNDKTYSDFIRCTLLPRTTEICFVDNTHFPNMKHEKVYYIQPLTYNHSLSIKTIIDRFIFSPLAEIYDKPNIGEYLYDWFFINGSEFIQYTGTDNNNYNNKINIMVAQKMMYHIKEFFYFTSRKNKTKKRVIRFSKRTRKKLSFL